jgi:hypothetical protein
LFDTLLQRYGFVMWKLTPMLLPPPFTQS